MLQITSTERQALQFEHRGPKISGEIRTPPKAYSLHILYTCILYTIYIIHILYYLCKQYASADVLILSEYFGLLWFKSFIGKGQCITDY
jgi:hypothetical protein